MLPLSFPPEITSLIVAEIVSQHPPSLSSIIIAWPDAIPFVREHRFKKIEIHTPKRLASFSAMSSPEVMSAVRRAFFRRGHHEHLDIGRLSQLVSTAVNLEEIELCDFEMDSGILDLFSSLRSCTRLTTVCLSQVTSKHPSDIVHALRLLPHLTTFLLLYSVLDNGIQSGDTSGLYKPWDTHNLDAPQAMTQVSCLELTLYQLSDLLFFDIVASPNTPFPNLRSIKLYSLIALYRHSRLRTLTLLGQYNASLRILEIGSTIPTPMSPEPESFTLPPNLESLKFYVSNQSDLDAYYEALSSTQGSLTTVTMGLCYLRTRMLPALAPFDMVLARLDLEQLNIEGSIYLYLRQAGGLQVVVEKYFPRCVERYTKGSIVRDTYIFRSV